MNEDKQELLVKSAKYLNTSFCAFLDKEKNVH